MTRCVLAAVVKLLARRRLISGLAAWIARFGYLLFILYGIAEWVRPGHRSAILRRRRTLVYCLFAVSLSSLLSACIGRIWARPRPFVQDPRRRPLIEHKANASFPSNHAMNAMAASAVLLSRRCRIGAVFAAWSLLLGTSRVICRIHYASDVAGGFVIGAVSALAVRRSAAVRRWTSLILWLCGGIGYGVRILRRYW